MWVLLRLLTAALIGAAKFLWRGHRRGKAQSTEDIAWVLHQARHKGRVVATAFALPFGHPVYFRLTRERRSDRFFKAIGFTREIQTSDPAFDATIYVSCDHPALAPILQEDASVRAAVLELFQQEAQRIHADGRNLWVLRRGDTPPDAATLRLLARIRDAFNAVPAEHFRILRDPFFWRALVVESVAWSVAVYAVPTLIEVATRPHPLYLDLTPLVTTGLLASVGVFAALFGLSWWLLRRSSRSHRVLTESALLLLFGVPFSSIQAVSDLNVGMDRSPPAVVECAVRDKFTRVTRSKGRSQTHYHLRLGPDAPGSVPLPDEIEVSRGIYNRTTKGGRLAIRIRAGAMGIPWVEDIRSVRAR